MILDGRCTRMRFEGKPTAVLKEETFVGFRVLSSLVDRSKNLLSFPSEPAKRAAVRATPAEVSRRAL